PSAAGSASSTATARATCTFAALATGAAAPSPPPRPASMLLPNTSPTSTPRDARGSTYASLACGPTGHCGGAAVPPTVRRCLPCGQILTSPAPATPNKICRQTRQPGGSSSPTAGYQSPPSGCTLAVASTPSGYSTNPPRSPRAAWMILRRSRATGSGSLSTPRLRADGGTGAASATSPECYASPAPLTAKP